MMQFLKNETCIHTQSCHVQQLLQDFLSLHRNDCVEKNVQQHRDGLGALNNSRPIGCLSQQLMERAQSVDRVTCGARKHSDFTGCVFQNKSGTALIRNCSNKLTKVKWY